MIEWVLLVVILCSVIQSVFGMGILVFGTPSLLLLGFGFTETLGTLLPASIAISALQLTRHRRPERGLSPDLWYFCVPMIGIGLALAVFGADDLPISKFVGAVLVASVIVLAVRPTRKFLTSAVRRHSRPCHAAMGLIHGVSNMGGSLLSVYAASVGGDKQETRYIVAYYYLVFGLCQLAALLITARLELSYNLTTALISAGVYLVLGNRVFRTTPEPAYKSLFMAFMAAYGAALLIA